MSKLYTYIVTEDTGLAPNPFFQWCTLALATPNHMHARAYSGDWIAGFFHSEKGYRLLFAMEVQIRLSLREYFLHPDFQCKKPVPDGTDEQKCGDNFYSFDNGAWLQHESLYHRGNAHRKKDTRHNPPVFASRKYWYFGKNAVEIPAEFEELIARQGIQVNHASPEKVSAFRAWVNGYKNGMHAYPRDFAETSSDALSIFGKLRQK
ncbi:hypothetical protein LJC19_06680 [Oxalobacter sp. OttesenSCG-928-P03]|nr:hypothetical protein [Oxalobacter sp. OttesenSCG-928-P03]